MTDWEAVRESILRATRASVKFQEAGEELVNHRSVDEAQAFAAQMKVLQAELDRLLEIMARGSQAASDDFAQMLTQLVYRESARYHTTPEPPRRDPESGL